MSVLAMVICIPLLLSVICWHARQLQWEWKGIRGSCWDGLLYWGFWSGILGMINPGWLNFAPYVVAVVITPYVMYRMEPLHTTRLFENQLSKLPRMDPDRTKKLMAKFGLSPEPPKPAMPTGNPPAVQQASPEAAPPRHPPKPDTGWGETRYNLDKTPGPA